MTDDPGEPAQPGGEPAQPGGPPRPSAADVLRSRGYLALLLVAAVIGLPISALAYLFLAVVSKAQRYIFTTLPGDLGFHAPPLWWPLPPLALAGILTALTIRYLPGSGGHSPADGFHAGGPPRPAELPGVIVAALAALCLGVVLGPEAPLIAIGGGLGLIVARLLGRLAAARRASAQRGPPPPGRAAGAERLVGSTGSFAAISTLLGSPLLGAFLIMEAAGLGGATIELVLVPGLLAAGLGSLIFVGLGHWTGLGTLSLTIGHLPKAASPDASGFGWALGIGLAAALVGTAIRWLGLFLKPRIAGRILYATPLAGLAIGGLAMAYAAGTSHATSDVLFSGQTGLGPLITKSASFSVGALALLLACKGLAYGVALGGFRGGPVFPSMYLGAAGGILLSHLPGLTVIPAAAMGMGALAAVLLRLPVTSVLLATLLLGSDGVKLMPLVIVAVVVAYVVATRIAPPPAPAPAPAGSPSAPGTPPPATSSAAPS